MNKRYNSINAWLRSRFGERVYKVSLDSGLGCPNWDETIGKGGCIFCNPESYTPLPLTKAGSPISPPDIRHQLEEGIAHIRRRHRVRKVIAYFQSGSNTHASTDVLLPILREAISHKAVIGLAVSTRPDCIDSSHIKLFEELARDTLIWIELGLQSAHDETLKLINRGHDVACFQKACTALCEAGINVCAHVILGLPGETLAMMVETANFLNETRVWGVKIHNLHVLKDTELARRYHRGEITIPSVNTYASWVADFLEALDPAVVIHRVNSHGPRHLTVAPQWSINKLAIFNAVEEELARRNNWQGCKFKINPARDGADFELTSPHPSPSHAPWRPRSLG